MNKWSKFFFKFNFQTLFKHFLISGQIVCHYENQGQTFKRSSKAHHIFHYLHHFHNCYKLITKAICCLTLIGKLIFLVILSSFVCHSFEITSYSRHTLLDIKLHNTNTDVDTTLDLHLLPPELLQSPGLSEPVNLTGSAHCRRYERKQRRSGLLFTDTWLICTIPNIVIDQEGRNIYRADNDATLAY